MDETKPQAEDAGEPINLADWIREKEVQQARAATARLVSIDEKRMTSLMKRSHMLAALVRATGRVRIMREDLEAIGARDRLDVKAQDNGDLVVTFLPGR